MFQPVVKLKALRAEHLHTQEHLSDILRISPATYNRKENGKGDFLLSEVKNILEYYGVVFEDVFTS